jgi:hypothetical protein
MFLVLVLEWIDLHRLKVKDIIICVLKLDLYDNLILKR